MGQQKSKPYFHSRPHQPTLPTAHLHIPIFTSRESVRQEIVNHLFPHYDDYYGSKIITSPAPCELDTVQHSIGVVKTQQGLKGTRKGKELDTSNFFTSRYPDTRNQPQLSSQLSKNYSKPIRKLHIHHVDESVREIPMPISIQHTLPVSIQSHIPQFIPLIPFTHQYPHVSSIPLNQTFSLDNVTPTFPATLSPSFFLPQLSSTTSNSTTSYFFVHLPQNSLLRATYGNPEQVLHYNSAIDSHRVVFFHQFNPNCFNTDPLLCNHKFAQNIHEFKKMLEINHTLDCPHQILVSKLDPFLRSQLVLTVTTTHSNQSSSLHYTPYYQSTPYSIPTFPNPVTLSTCHHLFIQHMRNTIGTIYFKYTNTVEFFAQLPSFSPSTIQTTLLPAEINRPLYFMQNIYGSVKSNYKPNYSLHRFYTRGLMVNPTPPTLLTKQLLTFADFIPIMPFLIYIVDFADESERTWLYNTFDELLTDLQAGSILSLNEKPIHIFLLNTHLLDMQSTRHATATPRLATTTTTVPPNFPTFLDLFSFQNVLLDRCTLRGIHNIQFYSFSTLDTIKTHLEQMLLPVIFNLFFNSTSPHNVLHNDYEFILLLLEYKRAQWVYQYQPDLSKIITSFEESANISKELLHSSSHKTSPSSLHHLSIESTQRIPYEPITTPTNDIEYEIMQLEHLLSFVSSSNSSPSTDFSSRSIAQNICNNAPPCSNSTNLTLVPTILYDNNTTNTNSTHTQDQTKAISQPSQNNSQFSCATHLLTTLANISPFSTSLPISQPIVTSSNLKYSTTTFPSLYQLDNLSQTYPFTSTPINSFHYLLKSTLPHIKRTKQYFDDAGLSKAETQPILKPLTFSQQFHFLSKLYCAKVTLLGRLQIHFDLLNNVQNNSIPTSQTTSQSLSTLNPKSTASAAQTLPSTSLSPFFLSKKQLSKQITLLMSEIELLHLKIRPRPFPIDPLTLPRVSPFLDLLSNLEEHTHPTCTFPKLQFTTTYFFDHIGPEDRNYIIKSITSGGRSIVELILLQELKSFQFRIQNDRETNAVPIDIHLYQRESHWMLKALSKFYDSKDRLNVFPRDLRYISLKPQYQHLINPLKKVFKSLIAGQADIPLDKFILMWPILKYDAIGHYKYHIFDMYYYSNRFGDVLDGQDDEKEQFNNENIQKNDSVVPQQINKLSPITSQNDTKKNLNNSNKSNNANNQNNNYRNSPPSTNLSLPAMIGNNNENTIDGQFSIHSDDSIVVINSHDFHHKIDSSSPNIHQNNHKFFPHSNSADDIHYDDTNKHKVEKNKNNKKKSKKKSFFDHLTRPLSLTFTSTNASAATTSQHNNEPSIEDQNLIHPQKFLEPELSAHHPPLEPKFHNYYEIFIKLHFSPHSLAYNALHSTFNHGVQAQIDFTTLRFNPFSLLYLPVIIGQGGPDNCNYNIPFGILEKERLKLEREGQWEKLSKLPKPDLCFNRNNNGDLIERYSPEIIQYNQLFHLMYTLCSLFPIFIPVHVVVITDTLKVYDPPVFSGNQSPDDRICTVVLPPITASSSTNNVNGENPSNVHISKNIINSNATTPHTPRNDIVTIITPLPNDTNDEHINNSNNNFNDPQSIIDQLSPVALSTSSYFPQLSHFLSHATTTSTITTTTSTTNTSTSNKLSNRLPNLNINLNSSLPHQEPSSPISMTSFTTGITNQSSNLPELIDPTQRMQLIMSKPFPPPSNQTSPSSLSEYVQSNSDPPIHTHLSTPFTLFSSTQMDALYTMISTMQSQSINEVKHKFYFHQTSLHDIHILLHEIEQQAVKTRLKLLFD